MIQLWIIKSHVHTRLVGWRVFESVPGFPLLAFSHATSPCHGSDQLCFRVARYTQRKQDTLPAYKFISRARLELIHQAKCTLVMSIKVVVSSGW